LKLLCILHYPPPVHGSSLVGGFIKASHLINNHFTCRYINLGTSASVDEIGKNPAIKLLRYFSLIWQVQRALLFFRPELCYLTISSKGIGFYKDALIVLLVRVFNVKRVYHFHNKGVRINQERIFDNLLYKLVFKNADVIILSKYLYSDVQKYVPVDRVHYCPNGIPALELETGKLKNEGLGAVTEILFLSHLIESKGIFILVEALKLVKDRGLSFHCSMIGGEGDVTEEQMRKKIKAYGLTDYVDVIGKKYGKEKQLAFEKTDIFVHPTYNDCLPLVLLEAMQQSLPIVSTPEGAIPDLVEDGVNGFLVSQKDPVALAEKLEVLIEETDLRQKLGAASYAKYEAKFTLERFEKRLTDILISCNIRSQ